MVRGVPRSLGQAASLPWALIHMAHAHMACVRLLVHMRVRMQISGVFSMDGDVAPLKGIVDLARKYNAYTFVGEGESSHWKLLEAAAPLGARAAVSGAASVTRAARGEHTPCLHSCPWAGARPLAPPQTTAMPPASWGPRAGALTSTAACKAR